MIIVCGLSQAQEQIHHHKVGSVIGILGPGTPHPQYDGIHTERHLKLTFSDINEPAPGLVAAERADAEKLIAFIRAWDASAPLLIHCWAGISRSTASAFAALCILRPQDDEMMLAQELRAASPSATPNQLITQKVDEALGREGRMVRAVESIGRGRDAFEGAPFRLNIRATQR